MAIQPRPPAMPPQRIKLTYTPLAGGAPTIWTEGPVGMASIIPPSPYLWWRFEELVGAATAADATSNARNGTIASAVVAGGIGKWGKAFDFPGGANNTVRATVNSTFAAFTLAAWIYADSMPNTLPRVFDKGNDFRLQLNQGNSNLQFAGGVGGVVTTLNSPTGSFQLNRWYHVAGVYDGANLILYVNGQEVARTALTGTIDNNTTTLRVGGNDETSSRAFDGRIDEPIFYNRALTAGEILALAADTPNRRPLSSFNRILDCRATLTQSIGDQAAELALDNTGGLFNAIESGGIVRLEVQRLQDAALTFLVEGYVGEPRVKISQTRPVLRVPVIGLNSILDLLELSQDHDFQAMAYTSMFDTLCTAYLTGYTRTITADAAAGTMKFPKGMKLREALDMIRRALNAATTPSKWEMLALKDGATREIRLFKRGAVNQATLSFHEAREGTDLSKGSAYHVVNRSTVRGAIVPSQTIDKTGLAAAGQVLLNAIADWASQPFVALDTPLYSHTVAGDRSSGRDPPSLSGLVARNSDNLSLVTEAIGLRYGAAETRRWAGLKGNLQELWNYNNSTDGIGQSNTPNAIPADSVFREYIAWDNGVAVACRYIFCAWSGSNSSADWKVQGSNDDAAWTDLMVAPGSVGTNQTPAVTDTTAYRYHRLLYKTSSLAVGVTLRELRLYEWTNLATDPATPQALLQRTSPGGISQAFGTTKEFYRVDLGAAKAVIKAVWSHSSSSSSIQVENVIQKSSNGVDWIDIGVVTSTSSTVIDNFYFDGEGDFRYLRFIVRDSRTSGANITQTTNYIEVFQHIQAWSVGPAARRTSALAGDSMRGSAWSWTVNNMVAHPALMEETSWAVPRLALTVGRYYWFLYAPQTGASSTSYWLLDYGVEATNDVLLNAGFDDYPATPGLPTSWSNGGTLASTAYTRLAAPYSGLYAVRVTGNAVGTVLLQQDLAGLVVGTPYTARVRVASSATTSPGRLRILNVTDALVVASAVGGGTSAFEELAVTWTPVAGKSYRLILSPYDFVTGDILANAVTLDFDEADVHPTAAGLPGAAHVSSNTGSTWAAVAEGAQLRHTTAFNNHELEAVSNDAASQAVYANFVPGGILAGGLKDEVLQTQDMVDKLAAAEVAARSSLKPRPLVRIPLRFITPGNQVTLSPDWLLPTGLSGVYDVLEVHHDVMGGMTDLILNDHPPLDSRAVEAGLAFATGRTM
jgi:hypothetical protein